MPLRRLRPYPVYIGLELWLSFFNAVAQTTVVVYWVSTARLDPLQLVLLGTVLEAAYLLLQVPTGVLADLVSRRLSVVAGVAALGLAFVVEGLSPAFLNLLLAQLLIALGAALVYGALEAWAAAELPDAEMTHVYVRVTQFGLAASVAGSLVSGLVMLAGRQVPLIAGGSGVILLALILALVMPETAREAEPEPVSVLAQVRATGRSIKAVPGLVLLFGMTALVGMWSESFDRLWGDFFIVDIHLPSALTAGEWFSVLAAAVAVVGLGTTELAKRRVDREGAGAVTGLLAVLLVVSAGCVGVMALAHAFGVAVAAYLVVSAIRPVYEPLVSGWMVKKVDDSVRATALSAREMCDSGGQIVGGPIFGAIGLWVSVRAALIAGAAVLLPAAGLLAGAGKAVRAGVVSEERPS